MHTIASDGRATIEEMAEAARERGYEYMAITDHSATPRLRQRRAPDQLLRQIERVRGHEIEGMTVLAGTEMNMLPDGSLDYEDDGARAARLDRRQPAHLVPARRRRSRPSA